MKTTKSLAQIASEYRKKNGNVVSKYKISVGKVFQYRADDLKNEIVRQSLISVARLEYKELSVRQYCKNLIVKKLNTFANAIPSDGRSMGSYYYIKVLSFIGESDRTSEYAKSCQYKAKHGGHTLRLTPNEYFSCKIIGGVLTQVLQKVNKHTHSVRWLSSEGKKQYYRLEWIDGYLTKDYHTSNLEKIALWRKLQATNLLEKRKANRNQKLFEQCFEKAKMMFYGYQDSLKAGNCSIGTNQFIGDKHLNAEHGYRGDFLLSMANGRTHFVERMITTKANELMKKQSL